MSRQINCLDYVPARRALRLIDFENLIGGPNTDLASAARSVDRYSDLSEYEKPDHLIIGVNPALAVDAGQFWPGAQLVHSQGSGRR